MYDIIAHYYDITHAELTVDIPFILDLADQTSGNILELGCGSGRLLLPLAQAGHTITGVDNSAAMLTRARVRLDEESEVVQNRVTLIEADMTEFEISPRKSGGHYTLIIIPYNTFLHLNPQQAKAALKQILKHLAPNGQLFIDLINPFAIAETADNEEFSFEGEYNDPESGNHLLQFASNRLDTETQTLHIKWAYDSAKPDGSRAERTIVKSSYYYRYPHQLTLLLEQTGFKIIAVYGDYNYSPFSEGSNRFLLLAVHC